MPWGKTKVIDRSHVPWSIDFIDNLLVISWQSSFIADSRKSAKDWFKRGKTTFGRVWHKDHQGSDWIDVKMPKLLHLPVHIFLGKFEYASKKSLKSTTKYFQLNFRKDWTEGCPSLAQGVHHTDKMADSKPANCHCSWQPVGCSFCVWVCFELVSKPFFSCWDVTEAHAPIVYHSFSCRFCFILYFLPVSIIYQCVFTSPRMSPSR